MQGAQVKQEMFKVINKITGKEASVYRFVSKEQAEAHIYNRKNKNDLISLEV